MEKILKSKTVGRHYIQLVENMGFLGGIDYYLKVDGDIKEISADRSYVERQYDNFW